MSTAARPLSNGFRKGPELQECRPSSNTSTDGNGSAVQWKAKRERRIPKGGYTELPNAVLRLWLPALSNSEKNLLVWALQDTVSFHRDDSNLHGVTYRQIADQTASHRHSIEQAALILSSIGLVVSRGIASETGYRRVFSVNTELLENPRMTLPELVQKMDQTRSKILSNKCPQSVQKLDILGPKNVPASVQKMDRLYKEQIKSGKERKQTNKTVVGVALTRTAEQIYSNHPVTRRDIGHGGVRQKLSAIIRRKKLSGPEAGDYLEALGQRHARHCVSVQWTKDLGSYVKSLDVWLDPVAERYDQPPAEDSYPRVTEEQNRAFLEWSAASLDRELAAMEPGNAQPPITETKQEMLDRMFPR